MSNFFSKNLNGKFFHGSLADKDFSQSSLKGANFCEVNLERANFSSADIRSAKFNKANLEGTKLNGAKIGLRPCYSFIFIVILLLFSLMSGMVSGYAGASFKIAIDFVVDIRDLSQPFAGIILLSYLSVILTALFQSIKNGLICIIILIVFGVVTAFGWVIVGGYWHLASAGAWGYSWVIAIGGFIALIACETALWVISQSIILKYLFILMSFAGLFIGVTVAPWAISGGNLSLALEKSIYWCFIWSVGVLSITEYVNYLIKSRKTVAFNLFEEIAVRIVSKYGTSFQEANLIKANFTGVNIKNSCFVDIKPERVEDIIGFHKDSNTFSCFKRNILDDLELRKNHENQSKENERLRRYIENKLEMNKMSTNQNVYYGDIVTGTKNGDTAHAHGQQSTVNFYKLKQSSKTLYEDIEKAIKQAEGNEEDKEAATDVLKKAGTELEKAAPDGEKIQKYLGLIQKILPTVAGLPWEKIIQQVKILTGL